MTILSLARSLGQQRLDLAVGQPALVLGPVLADAQEGGVVLETGRDRNPLAHVSELVPRLLEVAGDDVWAELWEEPADVLRAGLVPVEGRADDAELAVEVCRPPEAALFSGLELNTSLNRISEHDLDLLYGLAIVGSHLNLIACGFWAAELLVEVLDEFVDIHSGDGKNYLCAQKRALRGYLKIDKQIVWQ
ncbi:Hypothetical_protein [Hexamita inflata]|uniref:Hypothetical_protein n=1 Tax=Hexamita inflata TaxID=28002 RepID=A0ABP1IYW8_9EUKA